MPFFIVFIAGFRAQIWNTSDTGLNTVIVSATLLVLVSEYGVCFVR